MTSVISSKGNNLEVDVEVKSDPEKFWTSIRESDKLFLYKGIDIIEGDGKVVGSVRHFKFSIDICFNKRDEVDEAKKMVGYSIIEGNVLNYYKSFKAKLIVEPKVEKGKDDAPDPDEVFFKDFAAKTFKDIEEYLLKQA